MSKKRKKFSSEFKTWVALDALSGEHTIADLASRYGVHLNQISQWKKQAKEAVSQERLKTTSRQTMPISRNCMPRSVN